MPSIHNIDLIMNRLFYVVCFIKFFDYLKQNAITKDGRLLKKELRALVAKWIKATIKVALKLKCNS